MIIITNKKNALASDVYQPILWGPFGKRIYGHSRFCNTDFDDKWACLNLSGV